MRNMSKKVGPDAFLVYKFLPELPKKQGIHSVRVGLICIDLLLLEVLTKTILHSFLGHGVLYIWYLVIGQRSR